MIASYVGWERVNGDKDAELQKVPPAIPEPSPSEMSRLHRFSKVFHGKILNRLNFFFLIDNVEGNYVAVHQKY